MLCERRVRCRADWRVTRALASSMSQARPANRAPVCLRMAGGAMPRKQPLGRKYKVGRQGGDAKPKRAVPTTRDEEQPPAASSSARADVDVPRRLMIGLEDVLVERFVMELIDDVIFEAQVDLAAHAQSVVESRAERKKAYAALSEYWNSFLDADCWVDYDEARYHYLDTKAIVRGDLKRSFGHQTLSFEPAVTEETF